MRMTTTIMFPNPASQLSNLAKQVAVCTKATMDLSQTFEQNLIDPCNTRMADLISQTNNLYGLNDRQIAIRQDQINSICSRNRKTRQENKYTLSGIFDFFGTTEIAYYPALLAVEPEDCIIRFAKLSLCPILAKKEQEKVIDNAPRYHATYYDRFIISAADACLGKKLVDEHIVKPDPESGMTEAELLEKMENLEKNLHEIADTIYAVGHDFAERNNIGRIYRQSPNLTTVHPAA
jgi:hypothetical protein